MNITLEAIEQEIRKVAREKPDFDYTEQPLNVGIGECSYLGSIRKDTFKELQENGIVDSDLRYHEAVAKNLIGKRCIVGQALHNLGVSDTFLYDYEGLSAEKVVCAVTDYSVSKRPLLARWADSVQAGQDAGIAWGRAVEAADEQWEMSV